MDINQQFTVEPLESRPLRLPQFSTTLKILAVAVAVLLAGGIFIFFFSRSQFKESEVNFIVSGPAEVVAGEEVSYTVKYENTNNAAITNARLTFSYPDETLPLHGGLLADVTKEDIDIGTIKAHDAGEFQFSAIVVGHQGSVKTARAVMNFIPERLTTQLQVSSETNSTVTKMPVSLNVVAPPTVYDGQSIAYIIDYRNQTGETLRNLEINVKFPDGFTPSKPQTSWGIPMLEAGEGSRINIAGKINGKERENKTISVSLQKEITTSTSRFVVGFENADSTSVVASAMLSVVLNLQSSRDFVAHAGDHLRYEATVTNNTDVDLSSIVLIVQIDGSMFDLNSVDANGGYFDSRSKTITWNSAVIPELGLLRTRKSVVAPFSVNLKSAFPGDLQTKDSLIKATANVETFNIPDSFPGNSLSAADELITRITTAPTFTQSLVMNDTVFGAASPYPPKVDQTTTFTVKWSVINPSNELSPAKITGVLLPGVSWKGKFRVTGTQAQPIYDSKTSTLTWNLSNIPPGVGTNFAPYELYFQISITPSVNQIGQSPSMVRSSRFEGTDTLTGENIVLSEMELNTKSSVQQ